MLLDRDADEFLARRSEADAWLVKPINPMALARLGQTSPGYVDSGLAEAYELASVEVQGERGGV